ncbi:MAG: GumC family protein [Anaerolineaceae bacterium]
MIQMPKIEIAPYVNLFLRRKWWIVFPFILSLIGGAGYLSVCPSMYRASTLILLEPQSIPESFVRSTITETMEGRLRTISQQINSRTNLEKIIQEFHLDRQPPGETLNKVIGAIQRHLPFIGQSYPPDQLAQNNERLLLLTLVDEMRKNLELNTRGTAAQGGREQSTAFEISFAWGNQEIVAPVVNAIAARFIEENLNAREEMAISTTDFLDKETSTLRSELEVREKELEAFKKEYIGMLPDQLESNINILNQLRDQMSSLERTAIQERQQAMFLQTQEELARAERNAAASFARPEQGGTTSPRGQSQIMTSEQFTSGSLDELETELRRLSSTYTEKHPDIISLKRRIEALIKEGQSTGGGPGGAASTSSRGHASLRTGAVNANIDSYRRQIEEVQKQIESYKQRVERTPQVEMELNKILRGYETVRQRYDSLLSRKLDAKMAEQMERRKKGEQFRILDPAVRPPEPYKPSLPKILFVTLAVGLAFGFCLAYLREAMDPCFYNPEELEAYLDTHVILCLPIAEKDAANS